MRYRSKYVQLFERLKREILRGAYQRGQRLPGENEMAQEYGMSRQTVRQALSLLEQEDTKLWHFSPLTLFNMYDEEKKTGNFEIPEEV